MLPKEKEEEKTKESRGTAHERTKRIAGVAKKHAIILYNCAIIDNVSRIERQER